MARRDCPACDGTGDCKPCNGTGKVKREVVTGIFKIIDDALGGQGYETCGKCGGSKRCRRCNGRGHIPVD